MLREMTALAMAWCVAMALAPALAAGAASTKAAPVVTKLADAPANTWVRVAEKDAGIRAGSVVMWSDALGKFLVAQGVRGDKKNRIPHPYDVQVFDAAAGEWRDWFPKDKEADWSKRTPAEVGVTVAPLHTWMSGSRKRDVAQNYSFKDDEGNVRLNPLAACDNGFALAPDGSAFYLYFRSRYQIGFQRGAVWKYDAAARTWSEVAPSQKLDIPAYGDPTLVGAALVYEPVNDELLLLGGHCGQVERGSIGNWTFSLKTKTWTRLAPAGASDPAVDTGVKQVQDALALARNLWYGVPYLGPQEAGKTPLQVLHERIAAAVRTAAVWSRALHDGPVKLRNSAGGQADRFASEAVKSLAGPVAADPKAEVTPDLLKALDNAMWSLDRVAACLASAPPPRAMPAAAYDPKNKVVVLFGGDHFDYMMADTWVYDPSKRAWRQVFPEVAPTPRRGASLVWLAKAQKLALVGGETCSYNPRFEDLYYTATEPLPADVWTFDAAAEKWERIVLPDAKTSPVFTTAVAAGGEDVLLGFAGSTAWALRLDPAKPVLAEATEKTKAVGPGDRTYRSVATKHDPNWYDRAPRGNPQETAEWFAKMPANTWVPFPRLVYEAGGRDWGTAVYDPDRDLIYYWTGGHCSDKGNQVSTFHPAIHRWSIGFLAETAVGKGQTYTGRPDCLNHTYKNYCYDLVSKRLVTSALGGTAVYDPDRQDWTAMTLDQPFTYDTYVANVVQTPRGPLAWAGHKLPGGGTYAGLFDVAAMKWKELKIDGLPKDYLMGPDSDGMVWDSKRNCLWVWGGKGYGSAAEDRMYRYDPESGKLEKMSPKNSDTIGKRAGYQREGVYLPKLDLVVLLAYTKGEKDGRLIAYDPAANRWVTLAVPFEKEAASPRSLVYDTKRDLLWCISGYRRIFALRLDPKTLDIAEKI